MTTCKDCWHNEVCYGTHTDDSPTCCDFLDKSKLIYLPCKVGDLIFTTSRISGDYLRQKDALYAAKVNFIGLNDSKEMGFGFFYIEYVKTKRQIQVYFSDIGTEVFLTREEAERALK